jgi:hypothetical protein
MRPDRDGLASRAGRSTRPPTCSLNGRSASPRRRAGQPRPLLGRRPKAAPRRAPRSGSSLAATAPPPRRPAPPRRRASSASGWRSPGRPARTCGAPRRTPAPGPRDGSASPRPKKGPRSGSACRPCADGARSAPARSSPGRTGRALPRVPPSSRPWRSASRPCAAGCRRSSPNCFATAGPSLPRGRAGSSSRSSAARAPPRARAPPIGSPDGGRSIHRAASGRRRAQVPDLEVWGLRLRRPRRRSRPHCGPATSGRSG